MIIVIAILVLFIVLVCCSGVFKSVESMVEADCISRGGQVINGTCYWCPPGSSGLRKMNGQYVCDISDCNAMYGNGYEYQEARDQCMGCPSDGNWSLYLHGPDYPAECATYSQEQGRPISMDPKVKDAWINAMSESVTPPQSYGYY